MMRIALFDFGVGNIHSLSKALARQGDRIDVVTTADDVRGVDAIVLPGVGAFPAAAAVLEAHRDGIRSAIRREIPCLGICLGMQLLFEASDEGAGRGLGILPGHVRRLKADRIPQMGWNDVEMSPDPVFAGIDNLVAYYANSFVVEPDSDANVIAWSEYGADRFPAAVRHGNVVGVQFHPEKSGAPGLELLDNFLAGIR